jgi:hypothetical protein
VCHTVALPFTLKNILRQKKNYENSNISPCKNKIFKEPSKRIQNASRYYNSITNLKFQLEPLKNPYIKIDLLPKGQIPLYSILNLNTISKANNRARKRTVKSTMMKLCQNTIMEPRLQ